MTTSPTVRVHTDPMTIVIDIPAELWAHNDGIEHPNNHRMFNGTLVINGQSLHLQAIQVEDGDGEIGGVQRANAAEYEDDLNSLAQLNGDAGCFATSNTVDAGHEFVIYAVPYED